MSGDAISDYPNLANFSTYTWRAGAIDGRIYAIPSARAPIGTTIAYRKDLFDKAGVQMTNAPKDTDEFKRILQAVTRPQENQWGIASGGTSTFGLNTGSALLGVVQDAQQLAAGTFRQADQGLRNRRIQDRRWLRARPVGGRSYHPNTPTYGGNGNTDYAGGRFAVQLASGANTSRTGI